MDSLLTSLLIALSALTVSGSAAPFRLTDAHPNSPEFRRRFLASYGVNTEIEPKLSSKDRPLYEAVAPYLETDPRYAIEKVEAQLNNNSSPAFDFLLGNLYYSIQNYPVAKQHLNTAIEKFPSFRRAYRTLALIEVQQARYTASIPLWLEVIQLGGGDAQSYGLLGYAYLNQAYYYSALSAYEMAKLFAPDSNDTKRGLAQCLLMTENYAGAVALLDELIVDSPETADYWLLQANCFLAQENRLNAIANLEIAHSLGASSWQSLTLIGDLYLDQAALALAIDNYLTALRDHAPPSAEAAFKPLRALLQLQHYAEAKDYLTTFEQKVTQPFTTAEQMEYQLCQIRIDLGLGNTNDAQAKLQSILHADPLNGRALLLLGNYAKSQNDFSAAELNFERASHIEGFQIEAWESLGRLAVEQRDFDSAIIYFKKAYNQTESRHLADYIKKLEKFVY